MPNPVDSHPPPHSKVFLAAHAHSSNGSSNGSTQHQLHGNGERRAENWSLAPELLRELPAKLPADFSSKNFGQQLVDAHNSMRQDILQLLEHWLEREFKTAIRTSEARLHHVNEKLDVLLSVSTSSTAKRGVRRTVKHHAMQKKRMSTDPMSGVSSHMLPTTNNSDHSISTGLGLGPDGTHMLPSKSHSAEDSGNFDRHDETARMIISRSTSKPVSHAGSREHLDIRHWGSDNTHKMGSSNSYITKKRLASARYMSEVRAAVAVHKGRSKIRTLLWRFLENPYSSFPAWLYSMFVPIFVIFSVAISFLQTVKDSPVKGGAGTLLQAIFEGVYAFELLLRFWVCPSRRDFFCSLFNWIDFVSALPIAIRLFVSREEFETEEHASKNWAKTIVVAVPLVRLLKIIRRFEKFHLLVSAFQIAFEALPVLLYTLMLIALFFSVVIYFLEPMDNIGSLPISLWMVLVTMTTVGYGDKTPSSVEGHVVVVVLMIISSLYMAIPLGIVGQAFSHVWGNRDKLLLCHRIRDAFLQEGFTAESMLKIVSLFDEDGDGELDLDEFKIMLDLMHIHIGDERVVMLYESIDKDGGGSINVVELINSLFPKGFLNVWREVTDGLVDLGPFLKGTMTTLFGESSPNIDQGVSQGSGNDPNPCRPELKHGVSFACEHSHTVSNANLSRVPTVLGTTSENDPHPETDPEKETETEITC